MTLQGNPTVSNKLIMKETENNFKAIYPKFGVMNLTPILFVQLHKDHISVTPYVLLLLILINNVSKVYTVQKKSI